MIPKGVLWHAEIPRDINKLKMLTLKFGHFNDKKAWTNPLKKSQFLDKIQIFF